MPVMVTDRPARALIIACGALAHEIAALRRANGWSSLDIQCLPPELHNRPERIAPAVQEKIRENRDRYAHIFVAYGECGTRGALDQVLSEEGVERIAGAHCYEFFAGRDIFAALSDAEPGTFYLTDFLLRHFDRLVIESLGIDRHPELMRVYFGNYRRLVYLAQIENSESRAVAQGVARKLGLQFEYRLTAYGGLGFSIGRLAVALQRRSPLPAEAAACLR